MKRIVIVALAVLLVHGVAYAGVTSDTLNVTATVDSSLGGCIVSTNPLDFGTSDGSNSTPGAGSLAILCPADTVYSVALDAGLNYDGLARVMNDPISGGMLAYVLTNDTYSHWGDDGLTFPFPSQSFIGTGDEESISVLGELYTDRYGQPPDGTYSDVVTVTVSY